ncbi:MAG: FecR domain-containing protein [Ferruginibacter sp.]
MNDELLVKYLLGEAGAGEKKAVTDWINADAANSRYFLQMKKIWDSSKKLAAESDVDENGAWQRFQQRLAQKRKTGSVTNVNRFSWLKVAASVTGLIGLALFAWMFLKDNNNGKKVTAQATNYVLTDTLPDGSLITLNKRSSITYQQIFTGNTRAIALAGEAFFKVEPDKEKPFIITVNDVQIRVVGTSFNVKNEKGNTEIVVETGIVSVTRLGKKVELKAGEQLTILSAGGQLQKKAVRDHLYNYYRTKEFVCDDTPLWKLVEVLNKAYDADISIGRNDLSALRITTTFNNESLDKILEIIHLTFDIKVTRNAGQIILQ